MKSGKNIKTTKHDKPDLLDAISFLAREKDIDEELLIETISEALKVTYRKNNRLGTLQAANAKLNVRITRKEGARVYATKKIVEEVNDPETEISLDEAKLIRKDYQIDDVVEIDVTPSDFSRIAAQTAKQMLVQKIREAERGKIYEEYIEKEQEILTAIVQRVENNVVHVELGRTEGVMESSEFMPGEEYKENDHLKVYVLKVSGHKNDYSRNPQVFVSRAHPGLVKRLFELEVPEIVTGIVQIKSIAREPGSRTKIAVYSADPLIDPVGACVGQGGTRVEKVVNELKNEKIDIIKWSEQTEEFVANALNPAHVLSVLSHEGDKICRVVVPDSQLSLAIGKEGQNARLAAKLTGWKIDIQSESQYAQWMMEQGQGYQNEVYQEEDISYSQEEDYTE